jgi:hypothetical protein
MAEVVNLRQFRKKKARDEKEKRAARNRQAFGRGKSEKLAARQEREKANRLLDGHRLERSPDACDVSVEAGDAHPPGEK